jgi:hypothetical protein
MFSLLKNRWITKPRKVEFEPDEEAIEEKAKSVMMAIDDLRKSWMKISMKSIKRKLVRSGIK